MIKCAELWNAKLTVLSIKQQDNETKLYTETMANSNKCSEDRPGNKSKETMWKVRQGCEAIVQKAKHIINHGYKAYHKL